MPHLHGEVPAGAIILMLHELAGPCARVFCKGLCLLLRCAGAAGYVYSAKHSQGYSGLLCLRAGCLVGAA